MWDPIKLQKWKNVNYFTKILILPIPLLQVSADCIFSLLLIKQVQISSPASNFSTAGFKDMSSGEGRCCWLRRGLNYQMNRGTGEKDREEVTALPNRCGLWTGNRVRLIHQWQVSHFLQGSKPITDRRDRSKYQREKYIFRTESSPTHPVRGSRQGNDRPRVVKPCPLLLPHVWQQTCKMRDFLTHNLREITYNYEIKPSHWG